jgi:multicomponent K+:H+ antiporter subunit F
VIDTLYLTSEAMVALSALMMLVRAVRGPSVFDRAVAVETIALAVIAFLLLEAFTAGGRLYTDAALGLALFSFAGTVLLGFFLGRGDYPDE